MPDEEPPKILEPKAIPHSLRLGLRTLALSIFAVLVLTPTWAQHVANLVAIVFGIGAVYVSTIEPAILQWIVQRLRWAYSKRDSQSGTEADADKVQSRTEAGAAKSTSSRLTAKAVDPQTPLRLADETARQSNWPVWFGALGIAGMLVATWAVANGPRPTPSRPIQPQPAEPILGPVVESPLVEPGSQPPSEEQFFTITTGDTCYEIAAVCTGNPERFVELGSPVNNELDVSSRDLCLIRPGERLRLPPEWPTECAD